MADYAVVIGPDERVTPDALELALDHGLRQRNFTVERLTRDLSTLNPRGRRGIGARRELILVWIEQALAGTPRTGSSPTASRDRVGAGSLLVWNR